MKRSATIFLQVIVVLIAIGAAGLMLWEPHLEGRNADATLFEIYFKDPFLAYAYIAAIPFFVGVYQAFKVLGYAGKDAFFSPHAAKALRTIKYCALAIIGFVAGAEVIIMLQESDDRAGGVAIGVLIALASVVVAATAAAIERFLRKRSPWAESPRAVQG